jgi:hypothetical protein
VFGSKNDKEMKNQGHTTNMMGKAQKPVFVSDMPFWSQKKLTR